MLVICQIEYEHIIPISGLKYRHDSHYFLLLTRSDIILTFQEETTVYAAGHMLYCLPGQSLFLQPQDDYAVVDYVEFSLSEEEIALFRSLPLPVGVCKPPNFSVLATILKNTQYLMYSADRYRLEKGDLFLRSLLYATASGDEEPPVNASGTSMIYYKMRQLQKNISDNPLQYNSVQEAAEYVGISESWFLHLYRQYFGISFTKNIIRCKMERACTLLHTTDWTVARIAHELGYEDETYFYRQFRQQFGITPIAYRQMEIITV